MGYKYTVRSLREVDSTNNYIKRELAADKKLRFPFVVTADAQTAGRGRLNNRGFYSPRGGLYFSAAYIGSQIKCPADLLTVGVGTAVSDVAENICGEGVEVKWVNDVLYRGKKVCGILCESTYCESAGDTVYIVGIGVNTSKEAIGDFMPEKVGTLPVNITNAELMSEILDRIDEVLSDSAAEFLTRYNERLSMRGKRIDMLADGVKTRATVIGVTHDGLKCVKDSGEYAYVRTYDEILSDLYGNWN